MKKFLFACSAIVVLVGCANDQVVYKPHGQATQQPPDKTTTSPPTNTSTVKPQVVEKIGSVNLASYGIPIYPSATISTDSALTYTSEKNGARQIQVTLESVTDVPTITEWYKNEITAPDHAYSSIDLGTLQGTTATGHRVKIAIIKDKDAGKSIIAVTVEETPKK